MNKKSQPAIAFIVFIILAAALSRLVPHPYNFTPITGMALAGAAYLSNRYLAFLIPILAIWFSDLLLNNIIYSTYYDGFVLINQDAWWTIGAFILIVGLGMFLLKKIKVKNLLLSALSGSAIFFLISNFGAWASGTLYPKTIAGLTACYAAGIPYLQNTIAGDLVYTAVIFGVIEFSRRYFFSVERSASSVS